MNRNGSRMIFVMTRRRGIEKQNPFPWVLRLSRTASGKVNENAHFKKIRKWAGKAV